MNETPMIQVQNLYKTYRAGDVDVHALQGANLEVSKGEFVSIVGASGSGKSTLFNILGALTPSTSGIVRIATDAVIIESRHPIASERPSRRSARLVALVGTKRGERSLVRDVVDVYVAR